MNEPHRVGKKQDEIMLSQIVCILEALLLE
jgi:hypothetical protein